MSARIELKVQWASIFNVASSSLTFQAHFWCFKQFPPASIVVSDISSHVVLNLIDRSMRVMHLHGSLDLLVVHDAADYSAWHMLVSSSFFGEHVSLIPGHHCIGWIICLSSVIFVSLGSLWWVLVGNIGTWKGFNFCKIDCLALDDVLETKSEVSPVVWDIQATEWSAFTLVVQEHEHTRFTRVHNREVSGSLSLKRETDISEIFVFIVIFGSNKLNMIAILMHTLQEDELSRLDDGLYVVVD